MEFKIVVLLILTLFSLAGAVFIFLKTQERSKSALLISCFLLCFAFIFGETLALNILSPESTSIFLVLASYLFFPTILLLGPLFHLYNLSLVKTKEPKFFYKHRNHFLLPAMLFAIKMFCFVALDTISPESKNYQMLESSFRMLNFIAFFLIFFVQNLYYIYLAWDNYRLQKNITGASVSTLSWMRNFIITFTIVFIFLYFFQLKPFVPGKNIFRIYLTFYIGFLIYFGRHEYENITENIMRRKITDQKILELKAAMEQLMKTQKPYLEIDLNIHDLAKKLNTNPKYLSYLINTEYDQNFPSYINTLRIKEAKLLLKNPENQMFTIEAIAKMTGFRSKSSFNSAFKKNTSLTPSKFRKS